MIVKKVIQKTDCYKGVFPIEPHPPLFQIIWEFQSYSNYFNIFLAF